MTLIASMVFSGGVLIAADSKGTESSTGDLLQDRAYPMEKLYPIGGFLVWGSSGAEGVAQRTAAAFANDVGTYPGNYQRLVAEIEEHCRTIVKGVIQKELAALTIPLHLAMQLRTPPVGQGFLFAGICGGTPWLTEILWDGQMSSYGAGRGFHAIGSGGLAALTTYSLLEHHGMNKGPIEGARCMLYRIVDACIRSNAAGLGYPVRMWEIVPGGSRQIPEDELTAISDTVGLWESEERECLKAVAVPAQINAAAALAETVDPQTL